jgi:hypothetical protein
VPRPHCLLLACAAALAGCQLIAPLPDVTGEGGAGAVTGAGGERSEPLGEEGGGPIADPESGSSSSSTSTSTSTSTSGSGGSDASTGSGGAGGQGPGHGHGHGHGHNH